MLNEVKHLPGFSTNPQEILRFAQDDKIKEAQDDKRGRHDDKKSLLYSNK